MSDRDLYDKLHGYLANRKRLEEIKDEMDALDAEIRELMERQTEITRAMKPVIGAKPVVVETDHFHRLVVRVDPDSGGLEVEDAMRASDLISVKWRPGDDRPIAAEAVADHPVDDFTISSDLEDVA